MILKLGFYISWTTNNLICTDLQEAVTNFILHKQAAVVVLTQSRILLISS